jgi:D-arabinose 5-phosphate isomerase GutQ
MKQRIILLVTVGLCLAAMMALSGVALAQGGDVCVSIKGETKVDKGDSTCSSDSTSHAVAHNDSLAVANTDSQAQANNDSTALAFDSCTATAHNGEQEICP